MDTKAISVSLCLSLNYGEEKHISTTLLGQFLFKLEHVEFLGWLVCFFFFFLQPSFYLYDHVSRGWSLFPFLSSIFQLNLLFFLLLLYEKVLTPMDCDWNLENQELNTSSIQDVLKKKKDLNSYWLNESEL